MRASGVPLFLGLIGAGDGHRAMEQPRWELLTGPYQPFALQPTYATALPLPDSARVTLLNTFRAAVMELVPAVAALPELP